MTRYRVPCRWPRRVALLALLAALFSSTSGCDRAVLDPALRDGDEAALLRAAGLTRPEANYTLAGLVLEAAGTLRDRNGGTAVT